MTTVIYKNKSYRFISYVGLPGSEISAEHGGKFYRLPASQCELVRSVITDKHDDEHNSKM